MIRTSPGRLLPPVEAGPRQRRGLHQMPEHACRWKLASGLDQRGRIAPGPMWGRWTNMDESRLRQGPARWGQRRPRPKRSRRRPTGPVQLSARGPLLSIPDVTATAVGEWAASAEQLGFSSVSVIDRLVYDNLDPLIALAAAAEPAPDALAPYVTCLWEHRIGGGDLAYDQPILPDGCIDLVAVDGTLSWPVRRLAR